jgi:uncharacterized protein YndB with AHSA1/START domain
MIGIIAGVGLALAGAGFQSPPSIALDPLAAEAVVGAPLAAVWGAWTTREGFLEWNGVGNTELDLRVGGLCRSSYDPESNLDDDTVIVTEILAFDPERMLATRVVQAPSDFPFPNAIRDVWTVLYLEPAGEGRTRVTIRMFGFDESEESAEMWAFFEWGNQYEMDQLAGHFSQDSP